MYMKSMITFLKISILSIFFLGCSSYYLASYYDTDGIYSTGYRSAEFETIFNDISKVSVDDINSTPELGYLPWGSNPESTEVIYNFFPNYGFFMSYPYGYDSYYYGLGYFNYYNGYGRNSLFGNYYLSPYNYLYNPFYWNYYGYPYWSHYRNYRYNRWFINRNNEMYAQNNKIENNPSFSNSASRRGEKNNSSSTREKSSQNENIKISNLYSRLNSYGGVYKDRTRSDIDDRVIRTNLNEIKDKSLIGVYQSTRSYSNSNNKTRYVPNLSAIKNDVVKRSYQQIRSVNFGQRGNSFGSSSYDYTNNLRPNYSNNKSQRVNSAYSRQNSSFSSGGSRPSASGSNVSSSGGSRPSASGSRGSGKIN